VKIAARKSGSRVLLFTDGIATHGIGALDEAGKIDGSRKFYEEVGLYAKKHGYNTLLFLSIFTVLSSIKFLHLNI
jgi:hypothetical protein